MISNVMFSDISFSLKVASQSLINKKYNITAERNSHDTLVYFDLFKKFFSLKSQPVRSANQKQLLCIYVGKLWELWTAAFLQKWTLPQLLFANVAFYIFD